MFESRIYILNIDKKISLYISFSRLFEEREFHIKAYTFEYYSPLKPVL